MSIHYFSIHNKVEVFIFEMIDFKVFLMTKIGQPSNFSRL